MEDESGNRGISFLSVSPILPVSDSLSFIQRQVRVAPQRRLVLARQVVPPLSLEALAGDAFADPAAELGEQLLPLVAEHLEHPLDFVTGDDLGDVTVALPVNDHQCVMHMAEEVVVVT